MYALFQNSRGIDPQKAGGRSSWTSAYRAAARDPAVIGTGDAPLKGPLNESRRDPESNCIVKMSGGDVTRNSQGYGFFLFFLGRVGPKPTSTYNRHANRELFFLGGWARRSQAGCDNMSRDTMTH